MIINKMTLMRELIKISIFGAFFKPYFLLLLGIFIIINKKIRKISINEFLYLFFFLLVVYLNLIVGFKYIFDPNKTLFGSYLYFLEISIWIYIIHFLNEKVFQSLVVSFLISLLFFIFLSITWTLLSNPRLFFVRALLIPFSKNSINTTGLLNMLGIISIVASIFLTQKKTFALFVGSLILALLLQNRTLMLILSIYSTYYLISIKRTKLLLKMVVTLFGILLIIYLLSPTDFIHQTIEATFIRFGDEGLSSGRWDMLSLGSDLILKGEYITGGANPVGYGFSKWFHNGFLDSYKNAGLIGLITSVLLFIIIIIKQISNYKNTYGWIFLGLGLGVYFTSMVYEGFVLELMAISLLLSLIYRSEYYTSKYNNN